MAFALALALNLLCGWYLIRVLRAIHRSMFVPAPLALVRPRRSASALSAATSCLAVEFVAQLDTILIVHETSIRTLFIPPLMLRITGRCWGGWIGISGGPSQLTSFALLSPLPSAWQILRICVHVRSRGRCRQS